MTPHTRARPIGELVDELTGASGHDARTPVRAAIRTAAATGSSELASYLDHDDCLTRWEVVNLLGELRDPAVTERVVAFALAEDEVHARWRSFWAVSRFDHAAVVPLLLDALAAGAEPAGWRAALMLSMLGRNEAIPALVAGLEVDDPWIQWEALSALKALRVGAAVDAIVPFLDADRGRPLRQEATLALGAIGGETARRTLEAALGDDDPEIRWRASCGLSRIGDHRSIVALRARLEREDHESTARQIRTDLSRMEASHGNA